MKLSSQRKFVVCLTAAVLILVIGCEKEPILDIRDGIKFNPDTVQVNPSLKGWELYSWHSHGEWSYSLVPGTNRVKAIEEILSNPYTLKGREQFKLLLKQVPVGEIIVWRGPEWVQANVPGEVSMIEMPGLLTQYDLHSFCERKSLGLEFIP